MTELWLRAVKYPFPSPSSQGPVSGSSVKPAFRSRARTALTVWQAVGLLSMKLNNLSVSLSVMIVTPFQS